MGNWGYNLTYRGCNSIYNWWGLSLFLDLFPAASYCFSRYALSELRGFGRILSQVILFDGGLGWAAREGSAQVHVSPLVIDKP